MVFEEDDKEDEKDEEKEDKEINEVPYVRCEGKTAKGKRCKNKGRYINSFCKSHQSQVPIV